MPSFLAGAFAIAGVAAAAGPVLIHLLNRRRYRTVQWAAMDFLREAAQRSRRYLHLRDLLLLIVRTACLLLFGLAMARPYLATSQAGVSLGRSVHAVILLDNSLSMGYQRLEGTVLDEARQQARQFVEHLPPGSQVSVLPTCGGGFSWDAYRTREDALEALDSIAVVDCQTSAAQALDMAREACQRVASPAAKRIVFIGDQQAVNWPSAPIAELLGPDADLQVVQVAADARENAWVADLRIEDGVADVETAATLVAAINYEGPAARKDVQVTLSVDGTPVASKTIDLEPGQSRQVVFSHRFDVSTEPGQAVFSSVTVSIPADRLAADDERVLAVPVVAALPVVFVDQWGKDEDPAKNQYGETFRLRRLLAPVTSRSDYARQLVQVRHIKASELNRDVLQDARLLVIAGIENPEGVVPLVRQYVEQGGPVLLAAGGLFDPAAWNEAAWLTADNILPLPLEPDLVGVRPDEAPERVEPFFFDTSRLDEKYFHWDNVSPEETADLFRQPIFFQAIAADSRPEVLDRWLADEARRAAARQLEQTAKSSTDQKGEGHPGADWLLWDAVSPETDAPGPDGRRAIEAPRPRTLATFTGGRPALVQRRIGRGQVLLFTSSITSDWNTLATTSAVILFDRICRSLLLETLPRRTIQSLERLTLAVDPPQRRNRFMLLRPQGPPDPLTIDALGGDAYGLTIGGLVRRGIYHVACYRSETESEDTSVEDAAAKLWEVPVAVNGPAIESDLRTLDRQSLAERIGEQGYRWVARAETIDVNGAGVRGQDSWRWLMGMVLLGLVVELGLLARPQPAAKGGRMTAWLARLLGYPDASGIEQISPSLAAPWAHEHPGLVAGGCLLGMALALVFYLRFQPLRRRRTSAVLAITRAAALCLLLVILAEPTLVVKLVRHPRPLVWLLFDGSDSMAIEDDLSEAQRQRLDQSVGIDPADDKSTTRRSRIAYVQALLNKDDGRLLERLDEKFRVRAFRFDRADGVTTLKAADQSPDAVSATDMAEQLTTTGQVTALGAAISDLQRRHASSQVAGLVVFSDFDQNSGPAVLTAAQSLGVPVYPVGVGPAAAVDLAVDLQAPLLLKKGERTPLVATLRQNGLEGQKAVVRLFARRLDAPDAGDLLIGEARPVLSAASATLDFDYTPEETGRMLLIAAAEPLEGEVVRANNRATREVNVRDDFLRLMFVEYEPTWEWRFIKEVFHRDRLVGMRGFRTYLRSADPKVRQTNELFLSTMSPPRSDFFANDVIFLGDLPASALSPRFCELTKEFVSKFGGGLVVLSGPNFGPSQLAATPLADMLPVIVDADSRLRDTRSFNPRSTSRAGHVDFMQLGGGSSENLRAWQNLNGLPWYQPVARVHSLATVLLEHPQDTCVDGRTRQPLVAIRRYGRGEVVYLAMNETWRLRRLYGESYYRQFWGQMIHRLGLSHALGAQKRFVVRTDRQQYQADDKVTVSVEAYDENFEPLSAEKLADHKLWAELTIPGRAATGSQPTAHPLPGDTQRREAIAIGESREGLFEAQIPVLVPGEHRLRVKDPIAGGTVDVTFQVTGLSAERRSAVRNQELMDQLAAETGGGSFDLTTADKLPDEIKPHARKETMIEVLPVWNSWLAFGLVVMLLLAEWLVRKLVNLP